MTTKASRKLFVNLPVRDVKATMEFFSKLGFEFNRQFTDEKAACMLIGEDAYAMLLSEPFFKTFTQREICDTSTHTEALLTFSCKSRAEVEEQFGGLYRAFQYGAPPHGGAAFGIDRVVMLLCGAQNLREVTLFPMNQQAQDLLMGAPAPASARQLRELHMRVSLPDK